ncbi:MAG: class I SAM-dependent RNA methyltransferase, partial [Methylophilaceae bacterium]|nr:class I SAM-dependent RNA methyltransferase [Methylophilaceae bacterium]
LEAGLLAAVQVQHGDIREARAPQAEGILVVNPPYGVRLGEEDKLLGLYAEIGTRLKQEFAGWRAYFLTSDMRLPRGLGLKESRRTLLFNGALECRLFEFVLVAGQYRKPKRLTEE